MFIYWCLYLWLSWDDIYSGPPMTFCIWRYLEGLNWFGIIPVGWWIFQGYYPLCITKGLSTAKSLKDSNKDGLRWLVLLMDLLHTYRAKPWDNSAGGSLRFGVFLHVVCHVWFVWNTHNSKGFLLSMGFMRWGSLFFSTFSLVALPHGASWIRNIG